MCKYYTVKLMGVYGHEFIAPFYPHIKTIYIKKHKNNNYLSSEETQVPFQCVVQYSLIHSLFFLFPHCFILLCCLLPCKMFFCFKQSSHPEQQKLNRSSILNHFQCADITYTLINIIYFSL